MGIETFLGTPVASITVLVLALPVQTQQAVSGSNAICFRWLNNKNESCDKFSPTCGDLVTNLDSNLTFN